MAKPDTLTGKQLNKFLRDTVDKLVKQPDWPREVKIMKTLWGKYPDVTLWSSLEIKLPSLAWFLMIDGQQHIEKVKQSIEFEIPVKNYIELSKEKIGEDVRINKALTIKDFLN